MVAFSTGLTAVGRLKQWVLQTGSAAAAENARPAPARTLTPLKRLFSVKKMDPELRTERHLEHKAMTLL